MEASTLLQIFIFLQVFIVGVLAVIAFRHAKEHFWPTHNEPTLSQLQTPIMQLPRESKEHLLRDTEEKIETAIKDSAAKLQHDLGHTNEQINALVMRMATDIVNAELSRYKTDIEELKKQASAELTGISADVAKHKEEQKAKIAQELEAEKQVLIKQIDTKIADAVGSFLVETLSHNIDLGGQSQYLVAMLEEHKADLIREVGDEQHSA